LLAAADALAAGGRLFHVLGSHASDVVAPAIEGMHYRRVQLGAMEESGGRRWLTNAEISTGVHAAVLADRPYFAVGRIDRLDRA
jgi:hypothetical protein